MDFDLTWIRKKSGWLKSIQCWHYYVFRLVNFQTKIKCGHRSFTKDKQNGRRLQLQNRPFGRRLCRQNVLCSTLRRRQIQWQAYHNSSGDNSLQQLFTFFVCAYSCLKKFVKLCLLFLNQLPSIWQVFLAFYQITEKFVKLCLHFIKADLLSIRRIIFDNKVL